MKQNILVIDDKSNMLALLSKMLDKTARVHTARGVKSALAILEREPIAAVLCDLRMNDGDGLDVLHAVRTRWPWVPFILMTAYASVSTAVQAMRDGAFDYVSKPFEPEELKAIVARALSQSAVLGDSSSASGDIEGYAGLLGSAPKMRAVYELIQRFAPTDATVLILGETGTGKELVARAVHEGSSRAASRAVPINCSAIPGSLIESELFGYARGSFTGAICDRPGLFEVASGSTLFLDEIGELRPTVQAKLTRAIEERAVRRIGDSRERKVDVRLIAATHRDLRTMVKAGTFREDLWFRLNVCIVELPPLRDRPGDIPLLARRFLADLAPQSHSRARSISSEAMALLEAYQWPGNVRELRSVVERAAILEDESSIQVSSLPAEIHGVNRLRSAITTDEDFLNLPYRDALEAAREDVNHRYLTGVLRRFDGDVAAAAAHAGVERESFYRLLRRFGLSADAFRTGRRTPTDPEET